MNVNLSARSGVKKGIFFHFFNMKVYCVFLLESPHRGDSNEYTQYTIFSMKKEKHPKSSQICSYVFFPKGPKNEFETAMVNEPSVFEPLKFYCIYNSISDPLVPRMIEWQTLQTLIRLYSALKVGSCRFDGILNFDNLFTILSVSTFYKKNK